MMILIPLSTLAALTQATMKNIDIAAMCPEDAERAAWDLIMPAHIPYPTEFTQLAFFAGPHPKAAEAPAAPVAEEPVKCTE